LVSPLAHALAILGINLGCDWITFESGPRQVSATARRHGLLPSQLFNRRRLAREGQLEGTADAVPFARAVIACDAAGSGLPSCAAVSAGRIEIVLADGVRMLVDRDVDADALARVIGAILRRLRPIPSWARVWLPTGYTDMRKGFDGADTSGAIISTLSGPLVNNFQHVASRPLSRDPERAWDRYQAWSAMRIGPSIAILFAFSALLRLSQAHPGAAAVFVEELNAGALQR
jgi:transposase